MILSFALWETMRPVLVFVSCCACYNTVFLAVGSSKANITPSRLGRCCLSTPGGWVDQVHHFITRGHTMFFSFSVNKTN